MSITIIPLEEQSTGQFNGGEILENKPVVPDGNGNSFEPFSNLFYWAHAWSDKGSTIGQHPHQAFEILSFVLKGTIDHYDSKNKEWKRLNTGDVQIIRAGNGISHSERVNAGSSLFQIWFDPNMEKVMAQPASYNDYASAEFPVITQNGQIIRTFKGDDAPILMDTEGVTIKEITLSAQEHVLPLKEQTFFLGYLVEGAIEAEGSILKIGDCFLVKEQKELKIKALENSKIFIVETPVRPSYRTYVEMHNR